MDTRTLTLGGRFTHVAQWPTPALVLIEAHAQDDITLSDAAWSTSEGIEVGEPWTDLYGNRGQRLLLPAGESVFEWSATTLVPDEVDAQDPDAEQHSPEDLPDAVLPFLWPSRYCQSDVLSSDAWRLFGSGPRTLQRAIDVSQWVFDHVEYRTGSTMSWWSAVDTFNNGYGICRDMAHTFVALCRALNIPARYVSGYLPDMDVPPLPTEMDFHAWAEVFFGGRWWTIDPRHAARRKGHIAIARGRDAADVPLVTTFGNPWLKRMIVTCHEPS
ncbi:MAG: transglutaminase family protein [Propionibacteriaceae bacterium]|nr:transglutaminase family protein [Propionibacteriaceae bacterium]